MNKVSVAGLTITAETKDRILAHIRRRLAEEVPTFIVTPYSEFLYAALRSSEARDVFNQADISVADGIAILWAAKFLSLPLRARSFYAKIAQAFWQMSYTLTAIILRPAYIRTIIPEKIAGAELFFDLAHMAQNEDRSVYILGGFDKTPYEVAKVLQEKYPDIKISGASNKNPDDVSVLEDIRAARPDMLFVAYGPVRQERWIVKHRQELISSGVKVMIGLGGTFDYVAGTRKSPPSMVRSGGWEWLFRLITQPRRAGRIVNATFGMLQALLRYKVFSLYPLRPNVVCVIINSHNHILICRRNPSQRHAEKINDMPIGKFANYWQVPQGGVEAGENVEAAALREAREETGLSGLRFICLSTRFYEYEWNNTHRPLWFNTYRYKGQRQIIAYLRYEGPDSEVKIDNNEFIDYQWVEPSQLSGIVHPERAAVTGIILADLAKGLVKQS